MSYFRHIFKIELSFSEFSDACAASVFPLYDQASITLLVFVLLLQIDLLQSRVYLPIILEETDFLTLEKAYAGT